ncbi:MAG: S46 family peptidase [Bacteroidia bacterium]|nr:S46 family peptidase [Bacteroidia bacterium]
MQIRKIWNTLLLGLLASVSVFNTGIAAPNPPPDEGMWLPMLISRLNYAKMQELGCKLSPEEIYNVNRNSMKDAIVSLSGFCTGEIVSDKGLMLTNHHCAFSSIQFHSSVKNDYLTNGFWAKTLKDELPCPEIYASILVRMEDVTDQVLKGGGGLSGQGSEKKNIAEIEKKAIEGTHYEATVKPMFGGSEYYLFVYEKFTDVRLVGAPPSSIGKFGGDTDNWMWPRHTGDFSLFRIYSGPDGKPASFSDQNIPYKPKYFLPISLKGIKANDFSMIYGYPGSTDRYQLAAQTQFAIDEFNPMLIKLFAKRLEIMKKDMDADNNIRIHLADDYASLSNSYKYFVGQNEGLKHLNLVDFKKEQEVKFLQWAKADATRNAKYGNVVADMEIAVKEFRPFAKPFYYLNVAGLAPNILQNGIAYYRLKKTMEATGDKKELWQPMVEEIKSGIETFFKDYSASTDQKMLAQMFALYATDIPESQQPPILLEIRKKFKAKTIEQSYEKFAADFFKHSQLTSPEKTAAFLDKINLEALKKEPVVILLEKLLTYTTEKLRPAYAAYSAKESEIEKKFIAGLREMNPDQHFYPNANSTLRLTYGKIADYYPKDGVHFSYSTTLKGVMEKEIPKDPEFDVPAKLKDLYQRKDYGIYGSNGEMPVAFLSDNDITGGNSGSPVINGDGHLIGIAFDGNWEAMTGDLVFDPQYKRTISVDIRYVLFIIDKFADAGHLVQEMELVR